jgi:hypothetical protein
MRKSSILAVLFLALAGVIASVPAHADDYTYTFNLPVINPDGSMPGGTVQYSLAYTDALGQPDAEFVSQNAAGSALSGGSFIYSGFGFADFVPSSPGDPTLVNLLLEYADPENDILAFSFIEPVAYWDAPGEDVGFDNDGGTVFSSALILYIVPPTFDGGMNGDTNLGASYLIADDVDNSMDPPCSTCSVTITATPAAATPEPGSWILLGSGLAGLAAMVGRKLRA